MRGAQDRIPCANQFTEPGPEPFLLPEIQRGSRFIKQQGPPALRQRPRNQDSLLLSPESCA